MRLIATRKSDQNRTGLDPWTIVHFSAGLALGLVNAPLRWALTAAVAYEFAEQVVERQRWGQKLFATSGPEAVLNAVLDTAVFAAGHDLGRRWNAT